jgi:hypothetical protein
MNQRAWMLCPHLRECVSLTHIHTYTFKLTHTSAHLRLALAALKEQLIRAYASSAEIIKPLEGKVAELESRAAELTSALEKQQQLLEASESERKTLLGRVRQLEGREEGGENEGKGRASVGPTGGGEGGGRREEEKPPPSGGGALFGEGGVGQDSKYLQDQERLRRLWVLIPQLLCACVHACMCACVHVCMCACICAKQDFLVALSLSLSLCSFQPPSCSQPPSSLFTTCQQS